MDPLVIAGIALAVIVPVVVGVVRGLRREQAPPDAVREAIGAMFTPEGVFQTRDDAIRLVLERRGLTRADRAQRPRDPGGPLLLLARPLENVYEAHYTDGDVAVGHYRLGDTDDVEVEERIAAVFTFRDRTFPPFTAAPRRRWSVSGHRLGIPCVSRIDEDPSCRRRRSGARHRARVSCWIG
jgi:hypothetical protein